MRQICAVRRYFYFTISLSPAPITTASANRTSPPHTSHATFPLPTFAFTALPFRNGSPSFCRCNSPASTSSFASPFLAWKTPHAPSTHQKQRKPPFSSSGLNASRPATRSNSNPLKAFSSA